MKRVSLVLVIVGLGVVLMTGGAFAVTATQNVTTTVTVAARASLTLSANTLTFPDAAPDTTPSISASEGAITVTANGRTSKTGNVTLTVLAAGDLTDGSSDTILISNLTWTGSGTGYNANGAMSKSTGQSVGSWTGSGTYAGTLTYKLANSWAYATGTYTATVTYTLTAP